MNETDLADLKTAVAEAEASGDYSALDQMVRSSAVPQPDENSIRQRNVDITELETAVAALDAMKLDENSDPALLPEAMEIVAILRAAYREGEIEADRRGHGVGVATERN